MRCARRGDSDKGLRKGGKVMLHKLERERARELDMQCTQVQNRRGAKFCAKIYEDATKQQQQ